ncbi:protocatechuate 3,4-dioxygenase beta subunit [Nonomuraea polychroma]|uniref:Protocatechuate 3,4-dioxygenase beta subunit n=1 Tax=Nonomuraea polychroma TaxID=46176 RepID=A0A438MA77_9ACTN|nr:intradiol ring-cleavage dioxygenase [Nonomuraea polychroma]RVX42621.1 protocatechuate 3,4-dioxygenase beta subunit [Nonomuraea polychroma]
MHDHPHGDDIFDRGLQFDMSTLLERRRMLGLFAGAGLATLLGCSSDSTGATPASTASAAQSGTATGGSCAEIPEETAGPFPGDGSNGPNILTQSGIVRSDIRSSIGSASGTAAGVPLTIELTIQDTSAGCSALSGAAVYLWHCDRDGNYSMYSEAVTGENYLRGVQEADSTGKVSFTSIFPGCYAGRWPHVHFEVYPSLAKATTSDNQIATSQLALPKDICDSVYATDGYSQSVSNLSRLSLDSDNIFSDGYTSQLGTVAGSVSSGLTVGLTVPV